MRARDIMTTPVVTVTPQTTIKEAARTLTTRGFTALPVVDDDRLVGIVTRTDVMRARAEAARADVIDDRRLRVRRNGTP